MSIEEKELSVKKKSRSLTSAIVVPFVAEAVVDTEQEEGIAPAVLDSKGRVRATGRRKTSSARVWIKSGDGFTINKKKVNDYFSDPLLREVVTAPVKAVGLDSIEIMATVKGGGFAGQAGALRHGVSRALLAMDPSFRRALKSAGFLTRDSREVERKKCGKRKARLPQQFSKR
jgi:small subunit ribosomal protein S9